MKFKFYQKNLKQFLTNIRDIIIDNGIYLEVKDDKIIFYPSQKNISISYFIQECEDMENLCVYIEYERLCEVVKDNKEIIVKGTYGNILFIFDGIIYPMIFKKG